MAGTSSCFVVPDYELVLASDEGKATTEFVEEWVSRLMRASSSSRSLYPGAAAEEVDVVLILKHLVSQVGFVRRQHGWEIVGVRRRFASADPSDE
ncbi:hypothetical protein [Rhodococcus sp. JS3073]|uniref:hypothetical protein n=1 Tax=Rhodococcus sp. JS3073 TaxID=3002901 RepID=UPI0022860C34|nr:hypothetical protein [Rhodococcus sp. JS3073]WAM14806.1 hypothetical protein OYT95_36420 [Rhodococcus sp. JS3073]